MTGSGVEGVDSPNTPVLGRKREAMTTLWFLSELIVSDGDETAGETVRSREEEEQVFNARLI